MKTALIYNPEIKNYSFGKGHPFTSDRFENFLAFLKQKLPDFNNFFELIVPKPAKDKDLELFHSKEYIEAIKKASKGIILPNIFQYTTIDNLDPSTGYIPKGIHEAGKIAIGTSLKAAELVFEGKFKKSIALGGGLHHAKKERGEGFCIYNDVVISTKKLLKMEAKRVLILDTDAHAGNGTAEAFYHENQVLFIDIHQDPKTIYPGTGFINEIGEGKGKGFTINISLPPGASDQSYEYCFDRIIFPVAKEFKAEIIIRNGGSDPYFDDGLTNLGLTLNGFKMIGEKVRKLANEVCNGKEVDLIASGYNQKILPGAWLSLVSGLCDLDIKIKEKGFVKKDFGLKETKNMIEDLKSHLKSHWKCLR